MKITRRQLRKLIAESISDIKSGAIGQVPYEHPEMELRREIGDEYTEKLNKLKANDPAYRDELADTLGYDSEFGSLSEDEFEHDIRMAAQNPHEAGSSVHSFMSHRLGKELYSVRNKKDDNYTRGNNNTGDNYFLADEFLTALREQRPSPREALDQLFNKINQELNSGYETMLSVLRSFMRQLAIDALQEHFISKEEARRYVGDDINYYPTREEGKEQFPTVSRKADKYRK